MKDSHPKGRKDSKKISSGGMKDPQPEVEKEGWWKYWGGDMTGSWACLDTRGCETFLWRKEFGKEDWRPTGMTKSQKIWKMLEIQVIRQRNDFYWEKVSIFQDNFDIWGNQNESHVQRCCPEPWLPSSHIFIFHLPCKHSHTQDKAKTPRTILFQPLNMQYGTGSVFCWLLLQASALKWRHQSCGPLPPKC